MREGKYIYCIIATDEAKEFGPIGLGGRGDEVHNVCCGGLSAVISNTQMTKYELSPETLLAHERVVEKVMKDYAVLPVRFCTVAESVTDIMRLLELRHNEFIGLIKDLENKAEIGVKVFWKDMEIVFNEIVNENAELKDKGLKFHRLAEGDRVEIGKEVAKILDDKREEESDIWTSSLIKLSNQYKILKVQKENMVFNAVFLVENLRMTKLDEKVNELAGRKGNRYDVKYIGPTPPYNFVNLELKLGK